MVQREVAARLAAHPGTSDYGVLSATTQMYAHVESLLTLPPEAFSPQPQVHSTVLRLTMARARRVAGRPGRIPALHPQLLRAKTQGALEEPPQRRFRRAGHRSGA